MNNKRESLTLIPRKTARVLGTLQEPRWRPHTFFLLYHKVTVTLCLRAILSRSYPISWLRSISWFKCCAVTLRTMLFPLFFSLGGNLIATMKSLFSPGLALVYLYQNLLVMSYSIDPHGPAEPYRAGSSSGASGTCIAASSSEDPFTHQAWEAWLQFGHQICFSQGFQRCLKSCVPISVNTDLAKI